jgi:membrane-associated phospholipid phosphatase
MTRLPSPRTHRRAAVGRRWQDAALAVAGALLLVLAALPVNPRDVSEPETFVFRVVNDHTVLPFIVVWTVMQLGNMLAVPVAAAVAALMRRYRLALGMLVGGLTTYYLAKVVKDIVPRGRPAELLDAVQIRGAEPHGRGFVSGHAGVVTLLAVLAWPYLGRRARIAVAVAAAAVLLSRIYVGAHLPLDMVGGAALGLTVAGVMRLVLGRPLPLASPAAGH